MTLRSWSRSLAGTAVVLCLLASGCSTWAVPEGPAPVAYDGPLWVPPADDVPLYDDTGAAGRALDCHFDPLGGTNAAPYNTGQVGDDASDALRIANKERQFDGLYDELTIAAERDDRRLYVVQLDGRTYQALIFREGPATAGTGAGPDGIGWWLESWARCDIAEFPNGWAESVGHEVWTDAAGVRQPIHVITSHDGGDCVEGTRFLEIGTGDREEGPIQYVADGNRWADWFDEPYRAHLKLPADAVASPYRHGDERLWFSPDRSRAYVGTDPADVALWPRTNQRLGCA